MKYFKQETVNLNEIINQALDVLNDVSLTIEALTQLNRKMSPILSKKSFYGDKNFLIQEEVFSTLADHRDYLQKKYFEQT